MKKSSIFLLLFFLTHCRMNTSLNDSISSGTLENPEIESSIPKEFSEYQPYLETSNKIMDLVKRNDFITISNQYFPEFENKNEFTKKFALIKDHIETDYGKFKSYKKRQWNFSKKTDNEINYIQSIKIARYKKGIAYFNMSFLEGKPNNIMSFYINDPPNKLKLIKLSENYEYKANSK